MGNNTYQTPNFREYPNHEEVQTDDAMAQGKILKKEAATPSREQAILAMDTVISYLAKDGRDSHTEGTAERYIKAWEEHWGSGYDYEMKMTTFDDDGTDQMIIEMDIPIFSHCSHHLAPIIGKCHIAYLPEDRIIGLSKLNRVVEKFARRLQVQERLTTQIAEELQSVLAPKGVAVMVEAEHLCVTSRGVRHPGAKTLTTKLTGIFLRDEGAKAEFLRTVGMHNGG
jgi:GTP cyclohydrolase I